MGKLPFGKFLFALSLVGGLARPASAANDTLADSFSPNSRRPTVNLAVGAAAPVVAGNVGGGISVWGGRELAPGTPFYVGLDLGIYRWNRGGHSRDPMFALGRSAESVVATSVQLLPTFYYQFLLPMLPAAVPYLGMSIGPNLYFAEGEMANGQREQVTAIYPEILLRPGIHLVMGEHSGVTLEPKLGILNSQLVFIPQVSALWAL